MPPTDDHRRLQDRVVLHEPATVRMSFETSGLLRSRMKTIEVDLLDLSPEGAALDAGTWTPRDARELRLHIGSVSSAIEIRYVRTTNGGQTLHVRFHRPPPAFTNRVRAFIDQANQTDATDWLTARQTWTGT